MYSKKTIISVLEALEKRFATRCLVFLLSIFNNFFSPAFAEDPTISSSYKDVPHWTHLRHLVCEPYPPQVLAADCPIQYFSAFTHRHFSFLCCSILALRGFQQFKGFAYDITVIRDYQINPSRFHSICYPKGFLSFSSHSHL